MANVYVSSARYAVVAAWTALTPYVSTSNGGRGDYVRQLTTPAVGSERVFRCTVSGTSLASEPASWNTGHNATTAETLGPTWTECTGQEADQVTGTWRAPHARLANAYAAGWSVAGDVFYLGDDHASTQASAITLTSPGTASAPCATICVLNNGTVPPAAGEIRTGATIATTGANAITWAGGYNYVYGVSTQPGSGAVVAAFNIGTAVSFQIFVNCSFQNVGTSAVNNVLGNGSGNAAEIIFDNVVLTFANAGSTLTMTAPSFRWKNTASAIAGTIPTTLFASIGRNSNAWFDGVDFGALSGKTIVQAAGNSGTFSFRNCTMPSSVTVAGTPTVPYFQILIVDSDSAATNYRTEKYGYAATQTVETSIVRTSPAGATDGTTPISWKFIATANAKWMQPFSSLPIVIWNDTLGSITLSIFGVGTGVLNNDDVWIEVSYPGSGSTPLASVITTTKASILAANAATTGDGSTWGGSPPNTPFVLSATFTPALKGPLQVVIKVAKANATVYFDPRPVISGVSVSKSEIVSPGVYINERGGGVSRGRLVNAGVN